MLDWYRNDYIVMLRCFYYEFRNLLARAIKVLNGFLSCSSEGQKTETALVLRILQAVGQWIVAG